ncbi:MAG: V-type ATPase subunit, partial [Treponema sp.]|nr:V-type ATPase subunit [Treponema sp.]
KRQHELDNDGFRFEWGDSGYSYAKASWIIGKSFLGRRMSLLSGIHSLGDLDKLVFPEQHKELLGRELLADMESRIASRAVRQILSIVNSYLEPPKLLIRSLKNFEYSNLKECLSHIITGKHSKPKIYDIGRFKTIRFEHYPDVAAMIKKSEFEFLLSDDLRNIKPGMDISNPAWASVDIKSIETKIDNRFYQGLIDSLSQLSAEEREAASSLIADEISLRNCVWALRLRTYYQKTEVETSKYLMDFKLLGNIHQKKESLSSDAISSLYFPLDIRLPWRGWRWERFLNPEIPSQHWTADPRYFQNAASRYIYQHAFHYFHSSPMSVSAIYCFIKLKQFEEDLLTSIAEGLSLGMDSSSVIKLLVIPTKFPAEAA